MSSVLNKALMQNLNASGKNVWNAAIAEAIAKTQELKLGPYYFLKSELEKLKK